MKYFLSLHFPQNFMSATSGFSDMHSQATAYAKLAESVALNSGLTKSSEAIDELTDESGLMVLPVSAESTGLLPDFKGNSSLRFNPTSLHLRMLLLAREVLLPLSASVK